ncbi:U2 snRNP-associated SURP motif-containing protein-like [Limulus polyphemus]|uniref:U2 snRNP-associated SURP motif-containing protein-like n=1 Tax=Limulus polyphemus TaxID=6850 RepID=A0ABM1S5B0_LIMPO|nr:U2 snRNP-associated SURP motif-containing protein-like [Limulus polyphemus]
MSTQDTPKMKSFNIGMIGKKALSKKAQEKQKKEEEEKAAAEVYEEFVAAFETPAKQGKLFVRGAVINPGSGEEKTTGQSGKLYKPPKLAEITKKPEQPKPDIPKFDKPDKPNKKKGNEKQKSNLELFKEELKIIQEEREERHRLKHAIKDQIKTGKYEPVDAQIRLADDYRLPALGSYDTGDPNTTNLYLGNLNPKMTEQQLCEIFGRYGPLASVKIMWPRSDEEKARGRNCGFVAYMNRNDGERAMKNLNGKEIMNFEMKLGWGKAIPIPPHPIYIPPALVDLTLPPPPSGLPFNAQPDKKDRERLPPPGTGYPGTPEEEEEFQKILANAVVKVVIPTERNLLCLIHRMIEFVVREGPMFEAMIMNREIHNPMFRFLFVNQSPAHVYYRWRLYSILQGEHPNEWSTEEFRMFKGGSIWRPPPLNPYLQGMPEELVDRSPVKEEPKKNGLSESQRDRLEDMLRNMTPERQMISQAMIYCIEHAESAEEIVDCIAESLSIVQTPLHKKIARIYLISDILHNCSVKVANASFYRKGFQARLPEMFKDIHECFMSIEGRLKAEQFKQRIMNCFRAWEDWAIYPNEFLIKLQNIFFGLVPVTVNKEEEMPIAEGDPLVAEKIEEDIDGVPLGLEEDLESVPSENPNLDGVPLNDDLDGAPIEEEPPLEEESPDMKSKFVPSKWETVDPETVESQAITTSKWDLLDQQTEQEQELEDLDGQPMEEDVEQKVEVVVQETDNDSQQDSLSVLEALKNEVGEERRAKLREIELKVMKFQDELECRKRSRKSGMTISEQVQHYREKLIRKEREKLEEEHEREQERLRKEHLVQQSTSASRSGSHSKSRSRSKSSEDSRSQSPDYHSSSSRERDRNKKGSPLYVASPGDFRQKSSRSPRLSKSHRSKSPKKSRRSKSRSPKRSKRSRSRSPHRRRSSPGNLHRKSHKSKKSKH